MVSLALALALATAATPGAEGLRSRLAPAPLALYSVAWQRPFVGVLPLEVEPLEEGGVAVDPVTGAAVCGTRDGWLHAVRADGTLAWEHQAANGFAAPPTIDGDTVYAAGGDGRVYALALADGALRWKYDTRQELGGKPVVAGGVLLVMSLDDTLFALDARTGAHRWHQRRETPGIDRGYTIRGTATPVVLGDTVYAGYSDGYVDAVEVATGEIRWEASLAPAGDYRDVDGLWADGNRVFAGAYSGAVVAANAGTGISEWVFRAPGVSRVFGAKGLVFAVSATQLLALTPDTGTLVWRVPLVGAPGQTPALAGRWLLVPSGSGGLRFVEPTTGRTLRTFNAGSGVSGEPAVRGNRIYVLSNQGVLYALDVR
jgi:outer membrane protein assembly factor BamB